MTMFEYALARVVGRLLATAKTRPLKPAEQDFLERVEPTMRRLAEQENDRTEKEERG